MHWLLRPGLVESTCRVHVPTGYWRNSEDRFDPIHCACAHNMSNRVISPIFLHSLLPHSTHDCSPNSSSYSLLSRFYSCATTRPPSSPIATITPRYLLGLTFPDFDLAPKRNEKPV